MALTVKTITQGRIQITGSMEAWSVFKLGDKARLTKDGDGNILLVKVEFSERGTSSLLQQGKKWTITFSSKREMFPLFKDSTVYEAQVADTGQGLRLTIDPDAGVERTTRKRETGKQRTISTATDDLKVLQLALNTVNRAIKANVAKARLKTDGTVKLIVTTVTSLD